MDPSLHSFTCECAPRVQTSFLLRIKAQNPSLLHLTGKNKWTVHPFKDVSERSACTVQFTIPTDAACPFKTQGGGARGFLIVSLVQGLQAENSLAISYQFCIFVT